jgi:hypothetical protein
MMDYHNITNKNSTKNLDFTIYTINITRGTLMSIIRKLLNSNTLNDREDELTKILLSYEHRLL